ncbi:MAG: peptide-methionine (S)-S-oxide reductase MsrA [Cyanobacteria bacterium P01_H01_bin.26]
MVDMVRKFCSRWVRLLATVTLGVILVVATGFLGTATAMAQNAQATFAGGCFWCMEHPFDELAGVTTTTSGYMGGTVESPSYRQVSSGTTGHAEVVQISYDPDTVSYEKLLETFWHNVDPVDAEGQFCDKGSQYRSIIFYHDEAQRQLAESSKQALDSVLDQPIATEIRPAASFYSAEDYHQNYYQTHPARYRFYRFGCGRDQRLAELWGEVSE